MLTASDTITDRENLERVLKRRLAGNCFFLVPDAADPVVLQIGGRRNCEDFLVRKPDKVDSIAKFHKKILFAVSYTHLTLPTKRIV